MKPTRYMIVIYGKDNCPHCKELQKIVDDILHTKPLDFFADVQNLSTRQGLVAYAKSETINGQRIPALQIMKWNDASKKYEKIHDQRRINRMVLSIYLPICSSRPTMQTINISPKKIF